MSQVQAPSLPLHEQNPAATQARRLARRWRTRLLAASVALGVALLQVGVHPATAAGSDYILLSRSRLMSLPTNGDAWRFVVRVANAGWSAPELDDQDSKTNVQALAAALVYARTGDAAMRAKARSAIERMIPTYNLSEDAGLGPARQITGWVLTADLIGLDGAVDGDFRALLRRALTSRIGTHSRWGGSLRICQEDSDNNWGAWCSASRIAAALYLGDGDELRQAERVYRGFLGDRDAWSQFRGQGTSNGTLSSAIRTWSCDASPEDYVPTNPSCGDRSGAFPADAARSGAYSHLDAMYQSETTAGIVLATELLYQAGFTGAWTNRGVLARVASFDVRHGAWNLGSAQYHWPWVVNRRLGTSYPTVPAGYGRSLGYTDWLYGGGGGSDDPPAPAPTPDATRDSTPPPAGATPDPTPSPTKHGKGHHGPKSEATRVPAGAVADEGTKAGGKSTGSDGRRDPKGLRESASTDEARPDSNAMYFALGAIVAGLLVLVLLQSRRRPSSS
jgi:hypothetical protein